MKPASIVALFLLSGSIACSTPTESKPSRAGGGTSGASKSNLPAGTIATVGSLAVPEETVISVAKAQNVPPRRAAEGEVRDALFAVGALQRGYEDAPEVRAALRGRLARATLETLREQASATPITDTEVEEATEAQFVLFNRPEAFRVIHAAVLVPSKAIADEAAKAKTIAERIAERMATVHDADEFKARAESIDHEGLELVVQSLQPVAADGRVVDVDHPFAGERMVLPFARAAARLTLPGQKSGVVQTDYGFHVMMLLEKTPPYVVPLDERRQRLRDVIIEERAKGMSKELVGQLRNASHPIVERAADTLVATLSVDAHETP